MKWPDGVLSVNGLDHVARQEGHKRSRVSDDYGNPSHYPPKARAGGDWLGGLVGHCNPVW